MSESIRVAVDQQDLQVNAGESVQSVITVQNLSVAVGVFSVEVEGLESSWYMLSSSSVSLFPGDRTTTTLIITPPRASSSLAQSYSFGVKVVSQKEDGEEEAVPFTLEILPFYDFYLEIRPQRQRGTRAANTLSITNTGNAQMPFQLSGKDPEGVCRFAFSPEAPIVPAGETLEVAVTVRGKRPLRGASAQYQYEIAVMPAEGGDSRTAFAQLEVPPRIPNWIFRVAVLLILAVGIGAAVYYFLFYDPPVAVAELEVMPDRVVLTEQETAQLAAIAKDGDGNVIQGRTVSWTSSNPRLVRVAPNGRVTGVMPTNEPVVITATLLGQDLGQSPSTTITVLPTLVSTDCVRYEPESIRFGVSEDSKLVITDGNVEIIKLEPESDQENAAKLAKQHTMRCFIGRQDAGSGPEGAEVDFWIGGSGIDTGPIEPAECDAYNASNAQIRATPQGQWILTDGSSLLVQMDSQEDAQAALILARRHSNLCFIDRTVMEASQVTYLTQYWE